jgi:glucokinase
MTEHCRIVADIGGTNARFAIADEGAPGFSRELTLRCDDFDSAGAAIRAYIAETGLPDPDVICLATAGPVVDQTVRFTNNHWTIDASELQREFGTERVRLMNDFEAIAYSIPFLTPADCLPVGLPDPRPIADTDFTVAVVGPGTGLGAVGLIRRGQELYPVVGEAGHVGFSPETRVQLDILTALRERYDRVSVERLVSGPGLENIYSALTRIHGEQRTQLKAAEIFEAAAGSDDPRAAETLQLFFETLGQFAGNLALTLGAQDGIFIGGGIVRRYPQLLENSGFRSGFESKGRHRSLMEQIPTQLITHPEPGLLGASYCAQRLLRNPA